MGKEYLTGIRALEFARLFHQGLRKDGCTPEFAHQLSIARYVKTLHNSLMFPEETMACVFLHDTPEDADVGFEELEQRFGQRVAEATRLVTKKFRGEKIPKETYFSQMAQCPIASVVKGADRMHNLQTMQPAFSLTKQRHYCEETESFILPMLKRARRNIPEQEAVYENIKLSLENQIEFIRALHEAALSSDDLVNREVLEDMDTSLKES